jgi:glycosyltransferase involved in cell wall biosynthesis
MTIAASPQRASILLAANSSWNLLNFRAPIIEALIEKDYAVSAAVPDDSGITSLRSLGVDVQVVPVNSHGRSPIADVRLLLSYYRLFRRLRPQALLGFTAKPNIYGSIAAGQLGIPVINTITGLGTGFLSGRTLDGIITELYRIGLRRSHRIFFHNSDDLRMFVERGLVSDSQGAVVAGSGIDLERFKPVEPAPSQRPIFLFIGRMLKDKGALEFAQAAAMVRTTREVRFQMLGPLEDHPRAVSRETLSAFESGGAIELLGTAADVRPFIADADCVVLPSYREGLPRVLLEASAMAKPVITTDVPGCRQAVDDKVTGLLCAPKSAESLAQAIIRVADMPPEERRSMGAHGRQKAEEEFSQVRVVRAYLDALHKIGVYPQ